MNVKDKQPNIFETPSKKSLKQRTMKDIETESQAARKSLHIVDQDGINDMFGTAFPL